MRLKSLLKTLIRFCCNLQVANFKSREIFENMTFILDRTRNETEKKIY